MNHLLKAEAFRHGDRLQIVSVDHLEDLRIGLEEFKETQELNGFQQWIVNDLYQYEIPNTGFKVKSIIIMALYHPFCADIEINYQSKRYRTRSLVRSEFQSARKYLTEFLQLHNYHAYEVENLPIKRLAVQSGLAVYGRNNITYVEELGSNISYLTFYSDVPCEVDEWRNQFVAKLCEKCNACIPLCPTGAIRKDRFLIDNQRCLACLNEAGGDFPDWLEDDVHHTLYDCLRCQEKCPMNASVAKDTIETICFTQEETKMLLEGKGPEDFSEDFLTKVDRIALFDWSQGLPRNIRAIMKAADKHLLAEAL